MGEADRSALRCAFNGAIRIEGRGEHLTASAGVLALRELDERLGLTAWLGANLRDPRSPLLITHPLEELVRTRVYLMAAGHRDQDDADRLRDDPALRLAVSSRRGVAPLEPPPHALTPDGLASQPTLSRAIAALATAENRGVLDRGLFEGARRDLVATRGRRLQNVTLDVDSLPIKVHGHQAGSAYNGHYRMQCYHPIVTMLAETHHWLAADLRPGHVHTAAGATDHLLPVLRRVERELGRVASVRGDAGFPEDGLCSALEARGTGYAFRLRSNPLLHRLAAPFVRRPVGRPPAAPREWCHELTYRAAAWQRARRVVCVVLERPGELFLDYFFLVTNWTPDQTSGPALLEFYRQRGTMEAHLGELQNVLRPALSCTTRPKSHHGGRRPKTRTPSGDAEAANAATFLLYGLAYNLANSARRCVSRAVPGPGGAAWHLHRLRACLLAVAARIVRSARRATVVLNASVAETWAAFWRALDRLRPMADTT